MERSTNLSGGRMAGGESEIVILTSARNENRGNLPEVSGRKNKKSEN